MFHVVGLAAICWAIWKARNKTCFEKKLIRDPSEIIFHSCSFLKIWAELLKGMDKDELMKGAQGLLSTVLDVLSSQQRQMPPSLLIPSSSVVISKVNADAGTSNSSDVDELAN